MNTAFKLGEDVAEEWDLLFEQQTMEQISPMKRDMLGFVDKSCQKSGVTLSYMTTNWRDAHTQAAVAKIESVAVGTSRYLDWTNAIGSEASAGRRAQGQQLSYAEELSQRVLSGGFKLVVTIVQAGWRISGSALKKRAGVETSSLWG